MSTSLIPLVRMAVSALAVLRAVSACRRSSYVLAVQLEEMTATADRVFLGRCIAAQELRR